MERGSMYSHREPNIMGIFTMERCMERARSYLQIWVNISENSRTTSTTGREQKWWWTGRNTQETTSKARSKAKEFMSGKEWDKCIGRMGRGMKEDGWIISSMEMGNWSIRMEKWNSASGKKEDKMWRRPELILRLKMKGMEVLQKVYHKKAALRKTFLDIDESESTFLISERTGLIL